MKNERNGSCYSTETTVKNLRPSGIKWQTLCLPNCLPRQLERALTFQIPSKQKFCVMQKFAVRSSENSGMGKGRA